MAYQARQDRQAAPVRVAVGIHPYLVLPFLVIQTAPSSSKITSTGLGRTAVTVPVGARVPGIATGSVLHPAGVVVIAAAQVALPLTGPSWQTRVTAA